MKRISIVLALTLMAAAAHGATVRGKVVRVSGTPYPGAAVTLQNPAIGRSATVYTAADGVFLLRNIPQGEYVVEVKTPRATATSRVVVTQQPVAEVQAVQVP